MFRSHSQPYARGISLIDLMVGLAIGLLATLVILNVSVLFESRRKATVGAADAQISANYALALLERDLRMAGGGLGPPDAFGCIIHRVVGSATEKTLVLWPVTITHGANGAPDTLFVMSSAKSQLSTAARLIAPYAVGSNTLTLDSTLEIKAGDFLLLQETSHPDCLLLETTAIATGGYTVQHTPLPASVLSGQSFGAGSAVINLGGLHQQRYSLDASQTLQNAYYDRISDAWLGSSLAANVVNLQAQYGFDARPGIQTQPMVTFWSDEVIDADANGVAGNIADWRRLLAIRFAIVVQHARRNDEGCNASQPVWLAGNPSTGVLESTNIVIDSLPDWSCYRYRVLQTVVPLRNMIWSDA